MKPYSDVYRPMNINCNGGLYPHYLLILGRLCILLYIVFFQSVSQASEMPIQDKILILKNKALIIKELGTEDNYSREDVKSVDRIFKYCIEKDKGITESLQMTVSVKDCILQQSLTSPLMPDDVLKLIERRLKRASLYRDLATSLEELIAIHNKFKSRIKIRMNNDLRKFVDLVISLNTLSDRQANEIIRQMTNNLRFYISLQGRLFDYMLRSTKQEINKLYYANSSDNFELKNAAQIILEGVAYYSVVSVDDKLTQNKRLAPIHGYWSIMERFEKIPAFLIYDYNVAELILKFSYININELIRFTNNCNYNDNDHYRNYEVLEFSDFLYLSKAFYVNGNELRVDCKKAYFYKNSDDIDFDSMTNTATVYYLLSISGQRSAPDQHLILFCTVIHEKYYTADPYYKILDEQRAYTIQNYLQRFNSIK